MSLTSEVNTDVDLLTVFVQQLCKIRVLQTNTNVVWIWTYVTDRVSARINFRKSE